MGKGWITPYSTYFLSKYSKEKSIITKCECCEKLFITNIERKRCSKECANKMRKINKKIKP